MRKIRLLLALPLIILALSLIDSPKGDQQTESHTEWLARSLKEIETIKVAMTRADLEKLFIQEGELNTRTWSQFVYRKCPYIKIYVEFERVDDPEQNVDSRVSLKDKIVSVSRPMLEEPGLK